MIGTPRYMAPEALRGQTATPQSDLFSLGLLLCELATGQLPAPGRPVVLPRELDPLLGRCLARCLDLDPARRFPSGAALHAALRGPRRPRAKMLALLGSAALLLGTVGLRSHLASLRSPARPRGVVPGMVWLPGGTFRMDEVTNSEFVDFLLGDPSRVTIRADRDSKQARIVDSRTTPTTLLLDLFKQEEIFAQPGGKLQVRPEAARRPVQLVTWEAANLYCQAQGKRLPTEAEWEFAAGGGSGRRYPWGDQAPSCEGVAIDRDRDSRTRQPCTALPLHTSDVGSAPQDVTPEGIHDLGGNVGEWVQDRFLSLYPSCDACRDPVVEGPGQHGDNDGIWRMLRRWLHESRPTVDAEGSSEDQRVLRGGTVSAEHLLARTTGRGHYRRTGVFSHLGFRCATR